jgi:ABC-type bacteriocin/lantibiotic exporter with double-glycine peptidase domain
MDDLKKVISALVSVVLLVVVLIVAWPLFLALIIIIVGVMIWMMWQAKVVFTQAARVYPTEDDSDQLSDDIEHPNSHMDVIEVEYQEKEIK